MWCFAEADPSAALFSLLSIDPFSWSTVQSWTSCSSWAQPASAIRDCVGAPAYTPSPFHSPWPIHALWPAVTPGAFIKNLPPQPYISAVYYLLRCESMQLSSRNCIFRGLIYLPNQLLIKVTFYSVTLLQWPCKRPSRSIRYHLWTSEALSIVSYYNVVHVCSNNQFGVYFPMMQETFSQSSPFCEP